MICGRHRESQPGHQRGCRQARDRRHRSPRRLRGRGRARRADHVLPDQGRRFDSPLAGRVAGVGPPSHRGRTDRRCESRAAQVRARPNDAVGTRRVRSGRAERAAGSAAGAHRGDRQLRRRLRALHRRRGRRWPRDLRRPRRRRGDDGTRDARRRPGSQPAAREPGRTQGHGPDARHPSPARADRDRGRRHRRRSGRPHPRRAVHGDHHACRSAERVPAMHCRSSPAEPDPRSRTLLTSQGTRCIRRRARHPDIDARDRGDIGSADA
jgi:hypothetical protein